MNLRLKLPSVADALGEDPDDPMTTQDLDAPIGSPKPNVWIPDGANEDRPEFSSDDTGSDDGGNDGGGGGGQNVDDGGSDDGGASPQSEVGGQTYVPCCACMFRRACCCWRLSVTH